MRMNKLLSMALLAAGCATSGGGAAVPLDDADRALQAEVGARVKGLVVWSSARAGNHDLFVMNTDGSNVRQITRGETVDWFSRFSPDGSKILFTRSKKGWVYERDANSEDKWDIWVVSPQGGDERKVVENASWGSWLSDGEIIYVRGTRIFRRQLAGGTEVKLMDSQGVSDLDGALLQQPEMSRDGKYLAITLRGSKRETGIWDLASRTWTRTGLGCQINWTPDGRRIYWVNPTGNGGSEVFSMRVQNGKPPKDISDDELKFMDLPGRRSHEYFPQLSADGKWMVWAATQRGHDHDTADYEIYIWEVASPPEKAARLTFHSANDRWPDVFIPGGAAPARAEAEPGEGASGSGAGAAARPAGEAPGATAASEPVAAAKKPAKRAKRPVAARKKRKR
jgi:Tol biopolymer transport system component